MGVHVSEIISLASKSICLEIITLFGNISASEIYMTREKAICLVDHAACASRITKRCKELLH